MLIKRTENFSSPHLLPFWEFPFWEFIFYKIGLSTNTAIEPTLEHLKRFSQGHEREVYITLQWIKKPEDYDPMFFKISKMQA